MINGLLLLGFTWWVDSLTVGFAQGLQGLKVHTGDGSLRTLVALSDNVVLLGTLGK